ncbi:hypothetical protein QBC44DRAFT_307767 [Cladorrhinum sp. PSN332]|nr:hypothetical protein QBC44DRAFT_307767 [Cladorrhinum sp. PSN332]
MAEDAKRIVALTVKESEKPAVIEYLEEKAEEHGITIGYLKGQVDNERSVWRDMYPKQQAPYGKANVATALNKKAGPNRALFFPLFPMRGGWSCRVFLEITQDWEWQKVAALWTANSTLADGGLGPVASEKKKIKADGNGRWSPLI